MRLRINLQIMDDNYQPVETIPAVEALFMDKITLDTIEDIKSAVGTAVETHTRKNKRYDGLLHWCEALKKHTLSQPEGSIP
jgi:hypothetical protein